MTPALTISAAVLMGLVASGHCIIMCGGISGALGLATQRAVHGKPRLNLLIAQQAGRIASYTIAGVLSAGALGGIVALLDVEVVRRVLRVMSALSLGLAALVTLGFVRDPGFRIGLKLWPRLAPLGRRFLPMTTLPRAFAFGMIWGWMPCGLVYSVLLVATLQHDATNGALIMAAFGIGTVPALLMTSFGGAKVAALAHGTSGKRVLATLLVACGLLTAAGPWSTPSMAFLHQWLPMICHSR